MTARLADVTLTFRVGGHERSLSGSSSVEQINAALAELRELHAADRDTELKEK